jgi:hypothetical protein
MPSEILDGIFQHLLQPELHVLMLSNSNLTEVAAIYMYFQPHFFSTYRYAQFTYIVSHKEHYASMVRVLDLSYITRQGADEQGDLPPQAGWREFKYREHDMYYVRDRISAMRTTTTLSSGVKVTRITNSSHPAPSPFLKSFHRIRDLPIGGICHVLASCKKIKKVNLSRVQIASDFIVASPEHPATADSGLIYVSDVPKSWTWHSSELAPIYADEIVSWLTRLDGLEVVTAKSCLWLTTARVERFLRESGEKLGKVDFRESGMKKEVRWAVKGKRRAVERVAKEVLDNTKLEVRG